MTTRSTVDDWKQDLKISLRGLVRSPILSLTIILTVGLGIGATTAMFSAIHAALLRPLPYADAERLVRIYTDSPPNKFRFSMVDYMALDAQQTHFDRIAAYTGRTVTFTDGVNAERINGKQVSWPYFGLVGIRPEMGRDFSEFDGKPGNSPAVIVSHGFWQRRLGERADVIGKAIRLDGADYTLAGVLPAAIGPLEHGLEFFIAGQWEPPRRKGPFFYTVLGHLKPGVDRAAAAEELRTINRRIFPLWKSSYQDERATWSMVDLKEYVIGNVSTASGLTLAAVAFVWLIACANASNLLVARVANRRRELAVRAALGASRRRVVQCLLAESGLLALGSALVGVALAWAGIILLKNAGSDYFPRTQEIAMNSSVLFVLALVTAASCLIFGLIPALHGSGGSIDESLRSSGRSLTGSLSVRRLRRLLVGSQFAIATPLLVVAVLLIGSLNNLQHVDLGFDSRNILTGSIQLPAAQYSSAGSVVSFWSEVQRQVQALPGVTTLAFSDGRPPDDVGNFNNFELEDLRTPEGKSQPVTPWVAVTPEYFQVLGLQLLEGRLMDHRDAERPNLETVVVDRAWAKRFFPNGSAIGKRFKEGGCMECPWTAVVGVVTEVKYAGMDQPDAGTVYTPMNPGAPVRNLVLRTSAPTSTVLPSLRRTIHDLDPNLAFSNIATIDELVDRSLQQPQSLSLLIGAFAVVALVLSVIGIYGVMAYYVEQHSKDISIRLALGGSPANIVRHVVSQGMTVVAVGTGVGLATAAAFTRWMSSLLFGVSPTDGFTFTACSLFLMMVALAACSLPARRAASAQPSEVLRND